MFKTVLLSLVALVGLVDTVHLGLYIVSANLYDIKRLKSRRRPAAKRLPVVSVVIPAFNESKTIHRTLQSVCASDYPKFEVIVVDDGSHDDTAQLVTHIIRHGLGPNVPNRARRIKLVRQANAGKGAALNNAIAHQVRGSLMMCLDADSILRPDAISRAAAYFADQQVVGVAANVQIREHSSLLSLLQKFEHLIGYRSKKFYTLTNSEFIVGGVASTYRTRVIKQAGLYDTDTVTEDIGLSLKLVATGNKTQRILYADDVVAMTEGVQTYRALFKQRYRWKLGMLQNIIKHRRLIGNPSHNYSRALTFYRLPMAVIGELLLLVEPLMLLAVVALCFARHDFGIILGAYLTITLYILWSLWPDSQLSRRGKLRLTAYAPLMYFIFYVMNAVQVVSMLRCLKNFRQLSGQVPTSTTWVSPERVGGHMPLG